MRQRNRQLTPGAPQARMLLLLTLTISAVFAAFLISVAGQQTAAASGHQLQVIAPNGGEVLSKETQTPIKWHSRIPGGKVVIVLYKQGLKHLVIAEQAPNTGAYLWKIPATLPAANHYRIRIRLLSNLSVNDFSDHNFTIK